MTIAYEGRTVLVAGAGVAGAACADALLRRGASVVVVDRKESADTARLAAAGARVVIADEPAGDLLDGVAEVVVSPGFPPHHPLAVAALGRGVEVFSEPELAWRLRGPDAPPWLGVTGTNGKTTTTTMLAAILSAAGFRTAALGNIGQPLVEAGVDRTAYDVLAVELSSFQLHWSARLAPAAGALLNLADDHLDWHGGFDAYATAKTAVWRAAWDPTGTGVAVGNADDPQVAEALAGVPGRAVGFTLGPPAPGQLGVADGMLIDRAFDADTGPLGAGGHGRDGTGRGGRGPSGGIGAGGHGPGVALAPAAGIRPAGTHNVANALAAAALARAHGVPPEAVRDGLAAYQPEPHRNAHVATVAGVAYVDDSKATNPHAALASLTAYPRVVWIAGGQLKGVDVTDLVAAVAGRLAGAVLLGVDRAHVAAALARHAPGVPVVEVPRVDDGAMGEVVAAAAALAGPGDTVLLAPAAASLDMFASYAQRGVRFAAAVHEMREVTGA